jgi:class 3 adenylate cyclase
LASILWQKNSHRNDVFMKFAEWHRGTWSAACRRMLQLAPPGVWLAAAAIAFMLAWGLIDPFGLRQRLDWLVADQFLLARRAPSMHPDLLQVSIDQHARAQIGFPLPRCKLARVLRQLHQLGARTVMIDVLFADPGSQNPALDEASRQFVPESSVNDQNPHLRERFLEDHLLAEAMAQLDRLVIPFVLATPEVDRPDERELIFRMTDTLAAEPRLSADELARLLGAPVSVVSRLFDRSFAGALDRLVARVLGDEPRVAPNDALAATFPDKSPDSYIGTGFLKALDRARTRGVLSERASFAGHDSASRRSHHALVTGEPQAPPFALVSATRMLGFMDARPDADGTVRRLPLVASDFKSFYVHQALAAAILHLDRQLDPASLGSRCLRSGDGTLEIPLDASGCLTINWPIDGRRGWDAIIPQVSVADLYKLDGYEFDLKLAHSELRKSIAGLDMHAPGGGVGLASQFQELSGVYAIGDFEAAARIERDFDAGRNEVLEQPDIQSAIERSRDSLELADSPGTPPLDEWARAYVRHSEQIPLLEREYRHAFTALQVRVAGKLCLIGDTTTGSVDLKRTPIGGAVPGVSVIAAAVNTIITGRRLTAAGFAASACLMLAASCLVAFVSLRFNALPAGLCSLAVVGATGLGSFALLNLTAVLVSPVTPVLGLIAVYSTATTYRWWDEFQQKKLVRTIFETQTNPTIVDRLIRAGAAGVEEVLTPKQRQVSVFFAQIADYNEMADKVEPEKMAHVLSRVFGTMAKIILSHDGTLDRYEGHAMMAFFGAPVYQADHAERACRTALACREAVHQLAGEPNVAALPAIRVQFGLHTGQLLVGSITLTSRVDYTVAGENLSVAYRVADLNETYGTEIMITHATVERCDGAVDTRELDSVRIKGRREPVRAYELIALKGQSPVEKARLIGTFLTGLTAFRNRDYPAALSMFRACRADLPTDRATGVYIERCEKSLAANTQSDATTAD